MSVFALKCLFLLAASAALGWYIRRERRIAYARGHAAGASDRLDRQASLMGADRKPGESGEELRARLVHHHATPPAGTKQAVLNAIDSVRPVHTTLEQVIDEIDPRGPRPAQ